MSKNYEKLGGWLLFFFVFQWFAIVINGLAVIAGLVAGSGGGGNIAALIGGFMQVCIALSYVIYIAKKPMFAASLTQIRVILRAMTTLSVCGLAFIIIFAVSSAFTSEFSHLLPAGNAAAIFMAVVFSFMWNIIWFNYFKRSNRVAVYFGLLQPEDLQSGPVNIPEWEEKLRKEIADAFAEQEALSPDTAVAPESLAINITDMNSKYAVAINDMKTNRRQIRAVKGKYYYNAANVKGGGYINNVPVKFFKVCGIIVLVCLVLMAVAGIMMALNP